MKALVQIAVVAALILGVVMLYRRGQPAPATLDAYRKVSLRMSQDQIQAVLGRPKTEGPVVIRNAVCAASSEAPAQAGGGWLRGMVISRVDVATAMNASQTMADVIYEGSRGVVIIRDGVATMAGESEAPAVWEGLESGRLAITCEGIFRQGRTLEGVSASGSAKGIRNVSFGTLLWWPGPDSRAIVVQLANGEVCFKSYLGPAGEVR